MGLDMYAFTMPADMLADNQQVDIDSDIITFAKEHNVFNGDFAYWRKFNHLHGWMNRLYNEKGGASSEFNCDTVRLMPEDIDRLEQEAANLTPTAGFFFGGDTMDEDDLSSVRQFCENSREAFTNGLAVLYDSWW